MNAWKWIVALSFVIMTKTTVNAQSIDLDCVVTNCKTELGECVGNRDCLELMGCEEGCFSKWATDTTPQKDEVQKCTSTCQFSYLYNQPVSQAFLGCVATHACITIPPIPSTCKDAKPSQNLSAKDLEGEWWVVRGLQPVYDCYDCTHFVFSTGASGVDFSASYKVPLANGTVATIRQKTSIPNSAAGEAIKFSFVDAGIPTENTWYLLDKATDSSYVLVYYCGTSLTWNYEGGTVLSKKPKLPEEDLQKIASTYNTTVGVNFSKFCSPMVEGCM